MKVLCGLFIAILFAHLLCDGSCLADSLSVTNAQPAQPAQPPCHKHSGSSSDKPHSDLCTQGPLIEGKFAFQFAAILPVMPPSLPRIAEVSTPLLIEEGPPGILPSPVPLSILRI